MPIFRALLPVFVATFIAACGDKPNGAIETIEHTVQGAYAAALSSDGRYSITSSINHGVMVWDNQLQGLKYQWYQQQDEQNLVLAIAIAPDNSTAVTADKTSFAVWDLESGKNLGYYKIQASSIRDIAIGNQGRYILYGRGDGKVIHQDLVNGRRIEFLGHQEKINAVDLSPNGRYALTGSSDYVAYLWDTQSGQVIYRFNHPSRVTQVTLDPQGRYAFTADSQKQARIWDLTNGAPVADLQYIARQQIFSSVRFSPDARLLATGSPSRKLALWDVSTGKQLQHWLVTPRRDSQPKSAVVYDVAFTDQGTRLLSESSSGFAERFPIKSRP